MIKEVTMYSATCDHCKKHWHDDDNGWCAMSDESSLEFVLEEEGWHFGDGDEGVDGEHYCPECWGYDDDNNFVLTKSRS